MLRTYSGRALVQISILVLLNIFYYSMGENEQCALSKDVGTEGCDGQQRMYYFNAQLSICQPFTFLGCEGNTNRFRTKNECHEKCETGASKKSQWIHADKCNATYLIPDGRYTVCDSKNDSECPPGHVCMAGHGVCCPTKAHVCSLRDDSGTFAQDVDDKPRFAWSSEINSCWRFSYYGARGNYNNFPNFRSCVKYCREN